MKTFETAQTSQKGCISQGGIAQLIRHLQLNHPESYVSVAAGQDLLACELIAE
jgi:hypothetical protein